MKAEEVNEVFNWIKGFTYPEAMFVWGLLIAEMRMGKNEAFFDAMMRAKESLGPCFNKSRTQ